MRRSPLFSAPRSPSLASPTGPPPFQQNGIENGVVVYRVPSAAVILFVEGRPGVTGLTSVRSPTISPSTHRSDGSADPGERALGDGSSAICDNPRRTSAVFPRSIRRTSRHPVDLRRTDRFLLPLDFDESQFLHPVTARPTLPSSTPTPPASFASSSPMPSPCRQATRWSRRA